MLTRGFGLRIPDSGFTVTFRDVPEAIAGGGWTGGNVVARRGRARACVSHVCIAVEEPLPRIVQGGGRRGDCVTFGPGGWRKPHLYDADAGTTRRRAELACRLRWHFLQIRLLDLRHASRMERLEIARSLGVKGGLGSIRNARTLHHGSGAQEFNASQIKCLPGGRPCHNFCDRRNWRHFIV
jgi:hypothetical protein